MRALARELNNSETAFVLPSRRPDDDVRVRFFTPSAEVPVCGHATLAAHVVRGIERHERFGSVRQLSAGGVWVVGWRLDAAGSGRAWMVQEPLRLGDTLVGQARAVVIRALGASDSMLAARLPLQLASAGHSKLLVPLESVSALQSLSPDLVALRRVSGKIGVNGFFVFARESASPARLRARMFAPAIGIPEDPFNGSGQGPLGAYLLAHGLLSPRRGQASFICRMGDSVGRPGKAIVRITVENGRATRAKVEGAVVVVFRAELESSLDCRRSKSHDPVERFRRSHVRSSRR